MKTFLSKVFFKLGDMAYEAGWYWLYHRLTRVSVKLDKDNVVWPEGVEL